MTPESFQRDDGWPYLVGLAGSMAGQKIALGRSEAVIGRDASQCQIVVAHALISRRHAVLLIDARGKATLTDLDSRQGTFVNGELIAERELRDGDRIGFGPDGMIAFEYHAGTIRPDIEDPAPSNTGRGLRAHLFPLSEKRDVAQAALVDGQRRASLSAPADRGVRRIGRALDNEIVLDAPGVSRYHASLTYNPGSPPLLTDLRSTNGTFVNGEAVAQPRLLGPNDLVFIGGFLLSIRGEQVKKYDLSASRITGQHITKEVNGRLLLKDISLAMCPREFVGLMGPSGCGKSTLLDALNGLRPASSGVVYVNELDLYRNFDALRRSIGYVPQRDILHDGLSVDRTLYYAARLRLSAGVSADGIRQVVDEVISVVGLQEHRTTQFRQLSGGQQKRLSLAIELITKPSFIFLDEPTSPLDPETTENMMVLFRRLANEGRIVVMVTHKFEKFELMDQVAMLTRGGRLAYFGPPLESLEYFDCQEPTEIYRRIGAQDPDDLQAAFENSPYYGRYVRQRIEEMAELASSTGQTSLSPPAVSSAAERQFGFGQWLTLTRRFLEIKLKDKRNTLLLLAQAPVIAVLLAIIVGKATNNPKTLFIAAIISIWFGANNAIREIVAETPIYTRERLVNLKIPSYVFSKYSVLSGIALIQCTMFVGILAASGRLDKLDFWWHLSLLYITSLGGIATGLLFSALVNSTEKAMSVLPLILIPQLLLSGYLTPLEDLYSHRHTGKPASYAEFQRYKDARNVAAGRPAGRGESTVPSDQAILADEVEKTKDGLGVAVYASAIVVARWSLDGLVHTVCVHDKQVRDSFVTFMSVAAYQKVLDHGTEESVSAGYRQRVFADLAVLIVFNCCLLGLTMLALKRKDVL